MLNANVGAGIISIITESLYDKPIVVFREYVQNSVDSFRKSGGDPSKYVSQIWNDKNNLCFLDNGNGIEFASFESVMLNIGTSDKVRTIDIGYKGIGRLSGIPYCDTLSFINIISFKNSKFQKFSVDGRKYDEIKSQGISGLSFSQIMSEIGTYTEEVGNGELSEIKSMLNSHSEIFAQQDKGFLVILEDINYILKTTIATNQIVTALGWLLPVKFNENLIKEHDNIRNLFEELEKPVDNSNVIPAKAFNIKYNGKSVERPIVKASLRKYTCMTAYGKYAVGFHTFNQDRIQIIQNNEFSGIRLYIDNILLCDETELIPMLYQYGLISHSVNELIQTVKGIGAIIYITDKVNISANARRTFIEITDSDAVKFLELLATFVENIYLARYALSRYYTAKNSYDNNVGKLEEFKQGANIALQRLASEEVKIDYEDENGIGFLELDQTEQKKVMKRKLSIYVNKKIKDYLSQASTLNYELGINDFLTWFFSNQQ